MDEDTIEELRELGLQILITSLLAISNVLVRSAINKIQYGHISNYPSRRSSRQRNDYRQYDDDEDDEPTFIKWS